MTLQTLTQKDVLTTAVFTYSLTSSPDPDFSRHQPISDKAILNYTPNTSVLTGADEKNGTEVFIVGLCIDSRAQLTREEIPNYLANISPEKTVEKIYAAAGRFAGKYIVIVKINDRLWLWGDASCTLATYYATDRNSLAVAVTKPLVERQVVALTDERWNKLSAGVPSGQPYPADSTAAKNIRMLLPNHLLDLQTMRAIRQPWPYKPHQNNAEEIIEDTFITAQNIFKEYSHHYDLVCPLTAGYDSRLNMAIGKTVNPELPCFTFRHEGFSADTPDLLRPQHLCAQYRLSHKVIQDLEMPLEERKILRSLAGEDATDYAFSLAYTYRQSFGSSAWLNGNIIDQVGKSVTGNAIPTRLAGPRFIRARLYNSSNTSLQILKNYLNGIPQSMRKYTFDLVALENDCCRWGVQSDIAYGLAGVNMLNIFNCRDLIASWSGIPRKMRITKVIHTGVLARIDKQLLTIPFTPETTAKRMVRTHWPLFYVASFAYARYKRHR
ncbi:hypothetical protein [Varibaculum cambriense]|uniref:hypothetical protein n=1 Tax=Varibaculum cambriense TaxID=184870 RepID=UPI0003B4DD48|nr:hypothetical protein [Varibaculum cambriense]